MLARSIKKAAVYGDRPRVKHWSTSQTCAGRHQHCSGGRHPGQRMLLCSSQGELHQSLQTMPSKTCLLAILHIDQRSPAIPALRSTVHDYLHPSAEGGNGHTNGHRNVSLSISSDDQVCAVHPVLYISALHAHQKREDAVVKPAFGMQDEALEQQEQYSEKVEESQQQSEGAHQEEQQSQGDAAPSSQERIGFIGAGQVRLLLRCKGSQQFCVHLCKALRSPWSHQKCASPCPGMAVQGRCTGVSALAIA